MLKVEAEGSWMAYSSPSGALASWQIPSRLDFVLPLGQAWRSERVMLALREPTSLKQSQAQIIFYLPSFIHLHPPKVLCWQASNEETGVWYTGSRSHRPTHRHRRLRPLDHSSMTGAEVRQASVCLSSPLQDSTAHLLGMRKGLERVS